MKSLPSTSFVVLRCCSNKPFSKKAQTLGDVTQYTCAECQVTEHTYKYLSYEFSHIEMSIFEWL
jgi:hypothetical protein